MSSQTTTTVESIISRLRRILSEIHALPPDQQSTEIQIAAAFVESAHGRLQAGLINAKNAAKKPRVTSKKPGPKRRTKIYEAIHALAGKSGEEWGKWPNLTRLCKALDERKVPTPKTWETESWFDMAHSNPRKVRSYIHFGVGRAVVYQKGVVNS